MSIWSIFLILYLLDLDSGSQLCGLALGGMKYNFEWLELELAYKSSNFFKFSLLFNIHTTIYFFFVWCCVPHNINPSASCLSSTGAIVIVDNCFFKCLASCIDYHCTYISTLLNKRFRADCSLFPLQIWNGS